jgi:hypothetical protein
MKNLFKILALLFTMGLFVVSCENITDEPQIDEEIAQDNALAGAAIGDVFGATILQIMDQVKVSVESCPTDSYDGNILTLIDIIAEVMQ